MSSQVKKQDWVRFNLTQHYPLARRSVAMKSFPLFWLFALLAGAFVVYWQAKDTTSVYLAAACLFFLALCAASLVYHFSWRKKFYYAVVGSRLIIRKGVLRSRKILVPLSAIAGINATQSGLDMLFDLYRVNINRYGGLPLVLKGFSRDVAFDLVDYMSAVLESSLGTKTAAYKHKRFDRATAPLSQKVVSILKSKGHASAQNADDFKETLIR